MRTGRPIRRGMALAIGALALAASGAPAQQAGPRASCARDLTEAELLANVEITEFACAHSPFRLAGIGDFAGSGMRSAARDVEMWTTNTGLSDSGRELQGLVLPFNVYGTVRSPTGWIEQYLEIQFFAAAARGDWVRNRTIAPTLRNALGGGWTTILNTQRIGGYHQWSGHDGSVGLLHSGKQAGPEGCLDHGPHARHYPYGFPLLAGSDCPETWGTAGWLGRGWIGPRETWARYFRDVGPGRFTFDFWRVPAEYHSGKMTVGDFQVFGVMSDHGAEYRREYGSVIPGQTGEPTRQGYPIGLDVYFNAYSFKVPAVARGFIYEGLIVNNSKEVYGVGLDYDSLYFGVMARPHRINQRNTFHALPEFGAVLSNELGRNSNCDGARPVPGSISCPGTFTTRGFRGGATGFLVLKSPIGDLRNKHFNDPSSPFYAPNHPNRGDTITFNLLRVCNFDCTQQYLINNVRRGFGAIAASVPDILDGRDPRQLSALERWRHFQWVYAPDGSEQICDPTRPRDPGCFGYRVPGVAGDPSPVWTYSRRPRGAPVGPDTLWYANCRPPTDVGHPHRNRCTALWADTFPDKVLLWARNNIWVGAGPFPLKAGDTVAFVVAAFAAPDSATLMSTMRGFYNFYVHDFYLGPGQPPPPSITRVRVTPGSSRLGETRVTLYLDDKAEAYRDPYALKVVEQLRNPEPGSIFEAIARADPTAADRLAALANRNMVDTVYIFKTCDATRTVTASTSLACPPSPARDETGRPIGTGWVAYSWLVPDENGRFPKVWEDPNVSAGRSYIYSLLAATDGISLATRYLDPASGAVRDTVLEVVPPSRTSFGFRTANPWVVQVYVPASTQAGAEPARAELRARTGPVRFTPDQVQLNFFETVPATGRYRLVVGADAVVAEYVQTGSGRVDSTVITLRQTIRARMPDGSIRELPLGERTYRSTDSRGVPLAFLTAPQVVTRTAGTVTVRTTTMGAKTAVLLDAATGEPLFASSNLRLGATTPNEFQSHPKFRGFTLDLDDRTPVVTSPTREGWYVDGTLLRSTSWPSVVWLNTSADVAATGHQFGTYRFDFGAPIFGDELPVLDPRNRQAAIDRYTELLTRRRAVGRTEVSEEVLAALKLDVNANLTLADLIEVKLPFTARNLAQGEEGVGTPVRFAMLKTSKRATALLGTVPDTLTVPVPADVWIPGEQLVMLEEVELAETNPDGTLRLVNGQPVLRKELRVSFRTITLGCESPRATCNPVRGPGTAGAPGYVEVRPNGHPEFPNGFDLEVVYRSNFTSQSSFEFEVFPAKVGERITKLTGAALEQVRVVPNPYIVRSAFEFEGEVRRLMFAGLPPRGTISIFTASGQFVQRLTWEPTDLQGHGDLFWDMQTREGNEIAAGLYVYVLETTDPETGATLRKLGKFIVVR